MSESGFERTIAGAVVISLLNSPILAAQTLALPGIDVTAPTITHEPVAEALSSGVPVVISATVVDDMAVKEVVLFYRPKGESQYRRITMKPAGKSSLYMATIPGSATGASSLEYYIKAEDSSGNALLRGGSFSPLVIRFDDQKAAASEDQDQARPAAGNMKEGTSSSMKWVMIGVGILAVGALAASSGDGGGSSSDEGISVTITTTDPVE